MDAASGSPCMRGNRRLLGASRSTMAERIVKYSVHDQAILVDGQPVARIEVLPGELNDARLTDLMSAANRGVSAQTSVSGTITIVVGRRHRPTKEATSSRGNSMTPGSRT